METIEIKRRLVRVITSELELFDKARPKERLEGACRLAQVKQGLTDYCNKYQIVTADLLYKEAKRKYYK